MVAHIEDSYKILGDAFREAREMLGMSVSGYGQLFEVEPGVIAELERGRLPGRLDEKLLKLVLATVAARQRLDLLEPLLAEAGARYNRPNIFDHPFPLLGLFEDLLDERLRCYPWVSEGAVFRCRLLNLTDQSNGILLWAESQSVHHFLLAALPSVTSARINLLDGYTFIFIPAAYLFLKLDTTSPRNPLPAALSQRLKEELPIGLSIPREPFVTKSPDSAEVVRAGRRLFIFSPDLNSLNEIGVR